MIEPRFVVAARDEADMPLAASVEIIVNSEEFIARFRPLCELLKVKRMLESGEWK